MNLVKISQNIFREYDIRGIWGSEISADASYTIGRSFGSFIKNKHNNNVIIGHDNRESSVEISESLCRGLIESGVNVIDLGLVTTPMYYCAKKHFEIECGIMITASHNPREYNGFKISFSKKGNAYGELIREFRDYTNSLEFNVNVVPGMIQEYNIRERYLNLIKSGIKLGDRKVRVVVDCGNGTGSIIIKDVLDMFNFEYELLYCDSDPTFPNHHPDPSVRENMLDLSKKVVELGFDIGISFDGDADRVGLVDNKGNIIRGDLIMLIIYRALAPIMSPKKAVFDVKCSKALIDGLDELGYNSTMFRTGSSYLSAKVNEENYMFGGEFAGHMYFTDRFPGFDDGIYAGMRLLEIVSNTDKETYQLLAGINKYYSTEELKFEFSDEIKFDIVEKVKQYCTSKNYKIITVDGVRVCFDDSWALVRASNTGPNLTVRFEATTEKRLEEIKNEFTTLINSYK